MHLTLPPSQSNMAATPAFTLPNMNENINAANNGNATAQTEQAIETADGNDQVSEHGDLDSLFGDFPEDGNEETVTHEPEPFKLTLPPNPPQMVPQLTLPPAPPAPVVEQLTLPPDTPAPAFSDFTMPSASDMFVDMPPLPADAFNGFAIEELDDETIHRLLEEAFINVDVFEEENAQYRAAEDAAAAAALAAAVHAPSPSPAPVPAPVPAAVMTTAAAAVATTAAAATPAAPVTPVKNTKRVHNGNLTFTAINSTPGGQSNFGSPPGLSFGDSPASENLSPMTQDARKHKSVEHLIQERAAKAQTRAGISGTPVIDLTATPDHTDADVQAALEWNGMDARFSKFNNLGNIVSDCNVDDTPEFINNLKNAAAVNAQKGFFDDDISPYLAERGENDFTVWLSTGSSPPTEGSNANIDPDIMQHAAAHSAAGGVPAAESFAQQGNAPVSTPMFVEQNHAPVSAATPTEHNYAAAPGDEQIQFSYDASATSQAVFPNAAGFAAFNGAGGQAVNAQQMPAPDFVAGLRSQVAQLQEQLGLKDREIAETKEQLTEAKEQLTETKRQLTETQAEGKKWWDRGNNYLGVITKGMKTERELNEKINELTESLADKDNKHQYELKAMSKGFVDEELNNITESFNAVLGSIHSRKSFCDIPVQMSAGVTSDEWGARMKKSIEYVKGNLANFQKKNEQKAAEAANALATSVPSAQAGTLSAAAMSNLPPQVQEVMRLAARDQKSAAMAASILARNPNATLYYPPETSQATPTAGMTAAQFAAPVTPTKKRAQSASKATPNKAARTTRGKGPGAKKNAEAEAGFPVPAQHKPEVVMYEGQKYMKSASTGTMIPLSMTTDEAIEMRKNLERSSGQGAPSVAVSAASTPQVPSGFNPVAQENMNHWASQAQAGSPSFQGQGQSALTSMLPGQTPGNLHPGADGQNSMGNYEYGLPFRQR